MLFAVATKSRDLNTASDSAITSDLLLYRIFNERINEKNWRRVFPLVLFVGENSLSSVIHLTLSKENLVKNIMNLHPFSLALLLLNSIKRTEEENIMKALL